jgi:hypothetical protein
MPAFAGMTVVYRNDRRGQLSVSRRNTGMKNIGRKGRLFIWVLVICSWAMAGVGWSCTCPPDCPGDCDTCSSSTGYECESSCTSGQTCCGGSCCGGCSYCVTFNCDPYTGECEYRCESSCTGCTHCVSGGCVTGCGLCEHCESGSCVASCTGDCQKCGALGCESACDSRRCERCYGAEGCKDRCTHNPATCQKCDGAGNCICDAVVDNIGASKDYVCVNENVTFVASVNSRCNCVNWRYGGTPSTETGSCSFITKWATAGVKTVKAQSPCSSKTKSVTVVTVSSLEWKTYGSNTGIDGHPAIPNNGGWRIFPGKQNPDDNEHAADRRKVNIEATISCAAAGKTVYFKWYDVDDPSADTAPLDDNDGSGATGGDNKGKNSGEGLIATSATTDANGKAKVEFTVSMQPGDNFRIFASVDNSKLGEMTQPKADGLVDLPDTVVASPMLTTWRKLWIERDSMADIPETGDERNYLAGSADSYTKTGSTTSTIDMGGILDDEFNDAENHFEGGRYISGNISNPYIVQSNTRNCVFDDEVVVSGDPDADGAQLSYKLYDDDSVALPHYIVLGAFEQTYARAYIKIDYLPLEYQSIVTFHRNWSSDVAFYHAGDWDDSYNVPSTNNFWTVLVCTGFQSWISEDVDPSTDGACPGVTALNSNQCLIYYEVSNEDGTTERIAAHEIGHAGTGIGHCPQGTCIMEPEADVDYFCDGCLDELREHENF